MSTYLQIILAIIALPLILSFYPKIKFYKKLRVKALWISLVLGFFIVWDSLFTYFGVWEFNREHIFGMSILGLPVEEILFFPSVAFSMFFVFVVIKHYLRAREIGIKRENLYTLSSVFFIMGVLSHENTYTSIVNLLASLFVFLVAYFRFSKIKSAAFVATLIVSFVPFLIFNQMLTDIPVVLYNETDILGIRVGSIPIEDFVYSFMLIFLIIVY